MGLPQKITNLLSAALNFLKGSFIEDFHNLSLWMITCYAFGNMSYFALAHEPNAKTLGLLSLVLLFSIVALRKKEKALIATFALFFFSLGMLIPCCKTIFISSPKLKNSINYARIVGKVEKIHSLETGNRVVLSSVTLDDRGHKIDLEKVQITVRTKGEDFKVGDKIKLYAFVQPNSSILFPNKYDFARHAYFNQIGATGYALSKVKVIQKAGNLSILDMIERLRWKILEKLKSSMSEKNAGVAAALMIGEQKSIDKNITIDMRKSGLSHILSVSGMHLSLVSIISFFIIRYSLSNFVSFAQKYNTKKIAAWVSLLTTFSYFMISAMQIAALRAFIMVAFVIIAVLLDKEEDSKRSVCFAALFILLLLPESIFQPSFQMSFSSVLALVTFYEFQLSRASTIKGATIFDKIKIYFFGVLLSSLVAGLTTSMFVIYHFGNYSNYSIIANLLAAPIVSFIIMPAVIATFLLLPLGLHQFPIFFLNLGIEVMLKIAKYVGDFSTSLVKFPPISTYILIIFVIGFLWVCLWQAKWRFLGIVPIIISLIMLFSTDFPSIIIDAKYKVALVKGQNNLFKVGGTNVVSKSQKEQWLNIVNVDSVNKLNKDLSYNFDYLSYNLTIGFTRNAKDALEFDNLKITKNDYQFNIDKADLEKHGSYFIYINNNKLKYLYSIDANTKRPWS